METLAEQACNKGVRDIACMATAMDTAREKKDQVSGVEDARVLVMKGKK